MARTFRQIINTQQVKLLDVDSNNYIDATLVSYKPDVITVSLPDGTEADLYRSEDVSELYEGYIQGKQYTCQL